MIGLTTAWWSQASRLPAEPPVNSVLLAYGDLRPAVLSDHPAEDCLAGRTCWALLPKVSAHILPRVTHLHVPLSLKAELGDGEEKRKSN